MISNPGLDGLVDTTWISGHLDDAGVRLVEVDVSPATYNQGHLPGAVLWNAYADLRDPGYRSVPPPQLEDLLSRSGIGRDTTVVMYGYGAFLGYWLLRVFGHPDVRVFNGGRDDWERNGGAWSVDVPSPSRTSYHLPDADPGILAGRQEVERAAADPDSVLLDVRAPAEFTGERFWPSGATADTGRAGHIPGAVSLPVDLVRDAAGAPRDTESLRTLFAGAGVLPASRVVVYCTIGNRASLVWYILTTQLGYPDVAVYQGSYVEWGKLPDTEVALD